MKYILAFLPGQWEWVIVAVVALLLFFAKRVPEAARSLGKSLLEFKRGMRGAEEEEPAKPQPPTEAPPKQEGKE